MALLPSLSESVLFIFFVLGDGVTEESGVRKLTLAKCGPLAERQWSFWMRWLPVNRCLPHTASKAPWCDVTAFSHQPHWYTDDANDRTTLYTLFKCHMMMQRQQLGTASFFFFFDRKSFSRTPLCLILGEPPDHGNRSNFVYWRECVFLAPHTQKKHTKIGRHWMFQKKEKC